MKSPALLTASLLAMIFSPSQTAKASDIGLDFSLPSPNRPSRSAQTSAQTKASTHSTASKTSLPPLQIPAQAAHPPIASSNLPLPPTVYGRGDRLAVTAAATARDMAKSLPPPPPSALSPTQDISPNKKPGLIALHFNLDNPPVAHTPEPATGQEDDTTQANALTSSPDIFQGGANSLVAKAIGSAEGTRTPEGHRTPAYYGHIDPGNRAWNLGTFSYQHGAPTPEDADERQLKRLQTQTQQLDQKASTHGLALTLEEKLNGIDLANQAPSAALGRGGYLEWLSEAHRLGMTGSDAILWSRTRSFLDPDTQRWNAPGLGNTVSSISRDQERRMRAIGRAVDIHHPQPAPVIATKPEMASPRPLSRVSQAIALSPPKPKAEAADIIFSVSLQPSATTSKAAPSASLTANLPLPNQAPVSPESSPAITLESSSPAAASAVLPAPHLDSRAQQATVKDNPLSFPSFPNLAPNLHPASEQKHPSPISHLDVKTDSSLIAQAGKAKHENIDRFLLSNAQYPALH